MAMNWNTFFTRLGSAIIFAVIMMMGLLWNKLAFTFLAEAITILCLREYFKVSHLALHTRSMLAEGLLLVVAALTVIAFSAEIAVNGRWVAWSSIAFFSFCLLLALLMNGGKMVNAGIIGTAVLYIVLPLICFIALRNICMILPLALVLMIWMNDTMAYLVGSFIGKTPFNSISPKKTWEGTIGGIVLTVLGAALWGYYSPYYHMQDWIALSLCASIAGTAGDLFESKMKREAKIKDSGNLMPGHGGALDRFDSLLFAIPFAFAYAWLYMPVIEVAIF